MMPNWLRHTIFFALGLLAPVSLLPAAHVEDGIVAIVNSDLIMLSEIKRELAPEQERIQKEYHGDALARRLKTAEYMALTSMIERKLQLQEAKARSITVTDQEVQQAIRQMKQQGKAVDETNPLDLKNVQEQLTLLRVVDREVRGAVMVADRVGASTLATYLARFGLGRATGVGFPGESNGIILPLDQWNDTILATTAYGQGIAATPLQMVSVYSTIANDGRWVQPKLVRGTIGPDGSLDASEVAPARRVVSAGTARMVTRMLAYAVQDGTGTNAQIPGYQVAGKTGTARIPTGDGSGYLEGQYIASFIGYLPAGDPEVVVAAILDRPAAVYGGLAAAPLFKRVALAAIARLGIAPADRVPLPPHALPVG